MSNNKSFGFSGKGYYIALILCAVAIGISGYLYQQNANKTEDVSLQETSLQDMEVGNVQDVPAIATDPVGETTAPSATAPTAPTATQPAATRPLKTAAPVKGEQISAYSMESLSYNQTTRDWRVHNGVDIAAEEGSPVFAAAEGTVANVYEDDTMGYTVVLRHQDGYVTQYACLAENVSVQQGDRVALGEQIGCIGSTALLESALGSHVHFSVSRQDESVDPAAFLALG